MTLTQLHSPIGWCATTLFSQHARFLNEHLPYQWIRQAAGYNTLLKQWPPKSPDLPTCGFFTVGIRKRQGIYPSPTCGFSGSETAYSRDGVPLCLFGLGDLGKIKIPSTVLHYQSSGVFLLGENRASKLLMVIGIPPICCRPKKEIPAPGECTISAMIKYLSAA
ncbi:hypothetical protein TNCV_2546121 [Trichonephila clavipes]|nr:hypothetical protein TNCV_2546121 [Trichonephila clavipes]